MQLTSSLPSRNAWIAWASLLVAAYFAVAFLGWKHTLDGNEIWALYFAGRSFSEQLRAIRGDLVHPPLMYMLERLWVAAFGQTDNAAKALALILNLPTFFLFTWLASRVTSYWRLASFLFSSAYLRVGSTESQVRMYGLAILLAVTAMVLWEKWREHPSNKRLSAWTIAMILLVYTHMFGSWVLPAFLVVNWLYGPRKMAFTVAGCLAGVAFLPWFLYVFPVYHARGLQWNVGWVSRSPLKGLAEGPFLFLGSYSLQPSERLRLILAVTAAALDLLLFLLAWRTIRRLWPPHRVINPSERWFWTAVILVGLPVLLLLLISVVVTPAFHMRFLTGAAPAYWLVIVLLGHFGARAGCTVLYGAFLPWVLASSGAALVHERKPSLARQATMLVAQEIAINDLLLCEGAGWCPQVYWEWKHRLGRSAPIVILAPPLNPRLSPLEFRGLPVADLDSLMFEGVDRVWLFYDPTDRVSLVTNFLSSRNFVLKRRFPADKPFLLAFGRAHSP